MSEHATNAQAQLLEFIVKGLQSSLQERDLEALEGLFRHGENMTRRILDGKEGPVHPDWK